MTNELFNFEKFSSSPDEYMHSTTVRSILGTYGWNTDYDNKKFKQKDNLLQFTDYYARLDLKAMITLAENIN